MGCQAGCTKLQTAVLKRWDPQTYNAGCFNPASKLDGTNTPSAHALGEAIDIGIEPAYRGRTDAGQAIFLWLHEHRIELGILQLIWDGQIWSAFNQPGVIRPYTANPHRDHIHCQLGKATAYDAGLKIPAFPGDDVADPSTNPKGLFMDKADIDLLRAETNRAIGTIQTTLRTETIPAIIAGVAKATGADPSAIADAVSAELAARLKD